MKKCYWHEYAQDMHARISWCYYFHKVINKDLCSNKCDAYIAKEDCDKLIKDIIEKEYK